MWSFDLWCLVWGKKGSSTQYVFFGFEALLRTSFRVSETKSKTEARDTGKCSGTSWRDPETNESTIYSLNEFLVTESRKVKTVRYSVKVSFPFS